MHSQIPVATELTSVYQADAHCYQVWASLTQDCLAVMASSVSSKWAFSSPGITLSKCHNHLKLDVVEALQCLKCMIKWDVFFQFDSSTATDEMQAEEGEVEVETGGHASTAKAWDEMWLADANDEDDMNRNQDFIFA